MKFNVSTKLTALRIFLTFIIIIILIFPFHRIGINFPTFLYNNILVDLRFIISGIIFVFAAITDFFDGRVAKKNGEVTVFGIIIDTLADKLLVDTVLIIFASYGYISALVPVVVVARDIIVDGIRMNLLGKGKVMGAKLSGKIKTCSLMIGILFTFFYNLPFEVWNFEVSTALLYFGSVMSIISLFDYYYSNRKLLNSEIVRQ